MFKKVAIILLAFFLAGCTPIFVQEDKPIVLNNTTGQQDQQGLSNSIKEVTIKNINSNFTDGLVYDLSKDGKQLLMGNLSSAISGNVSSLESSLNLHLFNIKENQLKQILISSNEQINGVLDHVNDGMFYVSFKRGDNGEPLMNSYTLNWTNNDGTISKNISDSRESVSEDFYITDDILIYGNTKGEVKLVDVDKDTFYARSYNSGDSSFNIKKIQYHKKTNTAFMLVYNSKTGTTDLYSALLDKYQLKPYRIEENVSDFEISQKNNGILYCLNGEKNKLIYSEMLQLVPEEKILYEGAVNIFSFSPDEESIIFSEKLDRTSNAQNLWIMNNEGGDLKQVASNLKIAGDRILFSPNKNIIYFSVYNFDEDDSKSYNHKVYMIEYAYN